MFSSGGLNLYLKLYKYLSQVGCVVQPDSEWSVKDFGVNFSSSYLLDILLDWKGLSKSLISLFLASSLMICLPLPNQFPSTRSVVPLAINIRSYFVPFASIVARHVKLAFSSTSELIVTESEPVCAQVYSPVSSMCQQVSSTLIILLNSAIFKTFWSCLKSFINYECIELITCCWYFFKNVVWCLFYDCCFLLAVYFKIVVFCLFYDCCFLLVLWLLFFCLIFALRMLFIVFFLFYDCCFLFILI